LREASDQVANGAGEQLKQSASTGVLKVVSIASPRLVRSRAALRAAIRARSVLACGCAPHAACGRSLDRAEAQALMTTTHTLTTPTGSSFSSSPQRSLARASAAQSRRAWNSHEV